MTHLSSSPVYWGIPTPPNVYTIEEMALGKV